METVAIYAEPSPKLACVKKKRKKRIVYASHCWLETWKASWNHMTLISDSLYLSCIPIETANNVLHFFTQKLAIVIQIVHLQYKILFLYCIYMPKKWHTAVIIQRKCAERVSLFSAFCLKRRTWFQPSCRTLNLSHFGCSLFFLFLLSVSPSIGLQLVRDR